MSDPVVFRAGARAYTRSQVLSAAEYRSALDDVRAIVEAMLDAERRAGEDGIEVQGEELEAEAERYRIDRDLTTAEDTERWLADHDLTVDDFTRWLERRLLRQRVPSDDDVEDAEAEDEPAEADPHENGDDASHEDGGGPAEAGPHEDPGEDGDDSNEIAEETETDCATVGAGFRRPDAADETGGEAETDSATVGAGSRRPDAADETGGEAETDSATVGAGFSRPDADEEADPVWAEVVFGGHLPRFVRELAWRVASSREAGAAGGSASWDDELAAMERAFEDVRAKVLTPANVGRELAARRALLMVFEADLARFDSLDAAREAWLCVTEDGEPLEAVAAEAGVELEAVQRFLDDFPETIQPRVLSASEGEILSPIGEGDGFLLCRIRAKRLPQTADDPAVRGRIEAALMGRAMDDVLRKHVTWE